MKVYTLQIRCDNCPTLSDNRARNDETPPKWKALLHRMSLKGWSCMDEDDRALDVMLCPSCAAKAYPKRAVSHVVSPFDH